MTQSIGSTMKSYGLRMTLRGDKAWLVEGDNFDPKIKSVPFHEPHLVALQHRLEPVKSKHLV